MYHWYIALLTIRHQLTGSIVLYNPSALEINAAISPRVTVSFGQYVFAVQPPVTPAAFIASISLKNWCVVGTSMKLAVPGGVLITRFQ